MLSAAMAKRRAKASTLVALIERTWTERREIGGVFETESTAFGIAL